MNVKCLSHNWFAYRSQAEQKQAKPKMILQTENKSKNVDTFMDVDEFSAADEFPDDCGHSTSIQLLEPQTS